ncbi:hypothetical protein R3P38DRAFT_2792824 [Favolaschia claudopus]|uniref:Uncharacterized protein n=1 Tax=Favolaschia claudopus TaxID=2862362 RepID=A0AAW0AF54_9AGAR
MTKPTGSKASENIEHPEGRYLDSQSRTKPISMEAARRRRGDIGNSLRIPQRSHCVTAALSWERIFNVGRARIGGSAGGRGVGVGAEPSSEILTRRARSTDSVFQIFLPDALASHVTVTPWATTYTLSGFARAPTLYPVQTGLPKFDAAVDAYFEPCRLFSHLSEALGMIHGWRSK